MGLSPRCIDVAIEVPARHGRTAVSPLLAPIVASLEEARRTGWIFKAADPAPPFWQIWGDLYAIDFSSFRTVLHSVHWPALNANYVKILVSARPPQAPGRTGSLEARRRGGGGGRRGADVPSDRCWW